MAKIFVGIAKHKTCDQFIESMSSFLPLIKEKHEVEVYEVEDKLLVDAQNEIADKFLDSDKDYLLMLEDDHWGHTVAMLDALLKPNAHICAINYYSRHEGKLSTLMIYSGSEDYRKAYMQSSKKSGYEEVDLCGFGMTLIKRKVFELLDVPYFRPNEYYKKLGKEVKNMATDQNFCNRLADRGVKPVGCFDYILTHRGINENNFFDYRKQDIMDLMKNAEQRVTDKGFEILMKRQKDRLKV